MTKLQNRRKNSLWDKIIFAIIIALIMIPINLIAMNISSIFQSPKKLKEKETEAIYEKIKNEDEKIKIKFNNQMKNLNDRLTEINNNTKILIQMHLRAEKQ